VPQIRCEHQRRCAFAAIAEGFRTVLLHRGEQTRARIRCAPLEKTDNRISAMLPYLPVEHDDPVQRLRTVHKRFEPDHPRLTPPPWRGGILGYTPFMLCAKVIQALTRLPQQGIVTLATSAPRAHGHRLRLMGQRMDQLLADPRRPPCN